MSNNRMRNCCFKDWNSDKIFSAVSNSFLNSNDDFRSFSTANTNLSFLIPNNYNCTEAKLFTALNNFCYTADLNNSFCPFALRFFINCFYFLFSAAAFSPSGWFVFSFYRSFFIFSSTVCAEASVTDISSLFSKSIDFYLSF